MDNINELGNWLKIHNPRNQRREFLGKMREIFLYIKESLLEVLETIRLLGFLGIGVGSITLRLILNTIFYFWKPAQKIRDTMTQWEIKEKNFTKETKEKLSQINIRKSLFGIVITMILLYPATYLFLFLFIPLIFGITLEFWTQRFLDIKIGGKTIIGDIELSEIQEIYDFYTNPKSDSIDKIIGLMTDSVKYFAPNGEKYKGKNDKSIIWELQDDEKKKIYSTFHEILSNIKSGKNGFQCSHTQLFSIEQLIRYTKRGENGTLENPLEQETIKLQGLIDRKINTGILGIINIQNNFIYTLKIMIEEYLFSPLTYPTNEMILNQSQKIYKAVSKKWIIKKFSQEDQETIYQWLYLRLSQVRDNLSQYLTDEYLKIKEAHIILNSEINKNTDSNILVLQKARLDRQIEQFEELQRVLVKV